MAAVSKSSSGRDREERAQRAVRAAYDRTTALLDKYRPGDGNIGATSSREGGDGSSSSSSGSSGAASDLFELGCDLYQELTGVPVQPRSHSTALDAHQQQQPPAASSSMDVEGDADAGVTDAAADIDADAAAADFRSLRVSGPDSSSSTKRRERSDASLSLGEAAFLDDRPSHADSGTFSGAKRQSTAGSASAGSAAASSVPPLKDCGYPVSLSLLVHDLLCLEPSAPSGQEVTAAAEAADANSNDSYSINDSSSSSHRAAAFRRSVSPSGGFHSSFHSFTTTFATHEDVAAELRRMVHNPERFLSDSPGHTTGQLLFPPRDRLYGREEECQRLMDEFDRVIGRAGSAAASSAASSAAPSSPQQQPEHGFVVVRGMSGSGKSALVEQLRTPLRHLQPAGGTMIECRFDPRVPATTTIFVAFEDYCRQLLDGSVSEELVQAVRDDVARALLPGGGNGSVSSSGNGSGSGSGSGAAATEPAPAAAPAAAPAPAEPSIAGGDLILLSLMPSLAQLLNITDPPKLNDEVSNESFNRIVYSLRSFVRSIASPSHPVIIHFDDLQWADRSALELINFFVSDVETGSLLFLGCYRENEVTPDLEEMLRGIGLLKGVPLIDIHLAELDHGAVNDLVADTLHLSPHLTQSLSTNVHSKTRGNPLFVVQLLKSLYDDRLLQYSASARRWEWDIDSIRAEGIADNAVDLMLASMRSYTDQVQWVLRVAACLGSRFDEKTIRMLYLSIEDDPDGVLPHLDSLVADGLLLPEGGDREAYRFAHEQIWEASYALTPEEEREVMHMEVGKEVLRRATAAGEAEFEAMLFTIVDQINRGSNLVVDPVEKLQVAELNLVAGEKASSACAFLPASIYLLQGCVFLDEETCWDENYELSLRLHTALGEVQVAHGDNESATVSLEPVIVRGRSIQDQLRAQHAYMLALIAQGKLNEAVLRGLEVLKGLGESFPDDIDQDTIRNELERTELLIEGRSVEDILQCDPIADENKIAAMKFLTVTARIAYNSNQTFFCLPVLRMINISISNGLCPESSFAFATAALLLCNFGHRDLATHCADISIALLSKFNRQYEHVVLLILGLSIHQYRQPMQACLDQLRQAGQLAVASGDIMWGIATIGFIAFNNVYVVERGKSLENVEAEMRANIEEWRSYKHFSMDFVMLSFQAVLNLIASGSDDPNDDPSVLTGEAMEQEKALAVFEEMNLVTLKREMFHLRLYLAYLFHRYEVAAEMYGLYKEMVKSSQVFPTIEVVSITLYSGLLAAAMLKLGDQTNGWREVATHSLSQMEEWAKKDSEWNFRHRYDLIQAELASVDGNDDAAIEAYQKSFAGAKEHAFVNEQALASERMGLFYLQRGNIAEATKCLREASQLYEAWGSLRKADHVSRIIPSQQ